MQPNSLQPNGVCRHIDCWLALLYSNVANLPPMCISLLDKWFKSEAMRGGFFVFGGVWLVLWHLVQQHSAWCHSAQWRMTCIKKYNTKWHSAEWNLVELHLWEWHSNNDTFHNNIRMALCRIAISWKTLVKMTFKRGTLF